MHIYKIKFVEKRKEYIAGGGDFVEANEDLMICGIPIMEYVKWEKAEAKRLERAERKRRRKEKVESILNSVWIIPISLLIVTAISWIGIIIFELVR